ncbi:MAG: hypothetical protein AAFW84_04340 [Cyanobacteria bacterium J06635_15]
MIASSDVLNTARAVLHRIFYSTLHDDARMFSIEVCEQEHTTDQWASTIQVSQCTEADPMTFTLSLETYPLTHLNGSVLTSSFTMTASFEHDETHYGYWTGCWYQNGQRIASTVCERLHPLAKAATTTVDTTISGVQVLDLLDTARAAVLMHSGIRLPVAQRTE